MRLKKNEIFFRPTPLLNEIVSAISHTPLKGKHAIRIQHFFTEKDTDALLDYINRYMPEDVILHVNNGALADYITLQTARKTDHGMYYEIVTLKMRQVIDENRKEGFYVSADPYFRHILPQDYLAKRHYPYIIKRIGKYYVGHIPSTPLPQE